MSGAGINDAGVIAGSGWFTSGRSFAALKWDSVTAVPTLLADGQYGGETVFSVGASGINAGGSIIGVGYLAGNSRDRLPMYWNANGDPHLLPLPPGTIENSYEAYTTAINDHEVVVGVGFAERSDGGGLARVAMRWDSPWSDPTPLDFYGLGVGTAEVNSPRAISDGGIIVGEALAIESGSVVARTALLWDEDGKVVDLNSCIENGEVWTMIRANDINEHGWIVGIAKNTDGREAAVVLIPVPEPGAYVMASIASLILWTRRTRMSRTSPMLGVTLNCG